MSEQHMVLRVRKQNLSNEALRDVGLGVCKIAVGMMKNQMRSSKEWSEGVLFMDIYGTLGKDPTIPLESYEFIAEIAQREMERYVPKMFKVTPTVQLDESSGTPQLCITYTKHGNS